jgi:hypothetical protein
MYSGSSHNISLYREENFRVTSVLNVYVQRLKFDSTQVEVASRAPVCPIG